MGAVTVSINNVNVMVYERSFELDDSINNPSTIMFRVRDDAGTSHFTKGQPITITDSVNGIQYTGFVTAAIEDRVSPQTLIKTDISGRDNTYLAQKRTYDGPEFTGVPAGVIFCALLNILSSEGVTAQYASDRDTTATDFSAGTLAGVTGATNLNDGDLELTLAGSTVTKTETTTSDFSSGTLTNVTAANNSLTLTSHSAIKFTSYCNGMGGAGSEIFMAVWTGSYTIAVGDQLEFKVWCSSTSPEIKASMNAQTTDGHDLQTFNDQNSFTLDPTTDMSGYEKDQWFQRFVTIDFYAGKTISNFSVSFGGASQGQYTAYFRDVKITNGGSTVLTIFSSSLQSNKLLHRYGYSTDAALTNLSVVTAYEQSGSRVSPSTSLTAVGIFKSGIQSWTAPTLPAGTSLIMSTSLDGGVTWQAQTNLAPLQGVLAGASASGLNLLTKQDLAITGPDPTLTPVVNDVVTIIYPSYTATKTDVITTKSTTVDFSAGTLTNLLAQPSNAGLTLNGIWRSYFASSDSTSGHTVFGGGSPTISSFHSRLDIANNTGFDVRARFDYAGTWNVLDMQVTMNASSSVNIEHGLVYGCTNWGNSNDSYAYAAMFSTNTLRLARGSNSTGAGAFTSIASFTFPTPLDTTSWHTIRVQWNGTAGTLNGIASHTHNVYFDGTLLLTAVDATYTAAGNIGARMYNNSGAAQQAQFINFSVVNSYTNTTWLSPNYSLNSVGTCGNSLLFWNATMPSLSSILVETTINGGSTWSTATNGGQIPGLSSGVSCVGVNLQIRITFTEGIGLETIFKGFTAWVMSQFSSSGNRISPTLSLATITGRLGGSVVAWNSVLPSGCTLGVDTRIDAGSWTDQSTQNGLAVAGLNGQPSPTFDSFDTNTSANYTSTFATGGAVTSATFDTANSRLLLTGGTSALYINNLASSVGDLDMYADMDESDNGGLVFHYIDGNNYYDLVARDGSSSGSPQSSLTLFRTLTGVRTQLAQATGLTWPRGSQHRFRVTMLGSVIAAYFDGVQKLTFTDSTPVGAGKCGLRNDVATKISRYYQLNIQPQGDAVSSHTIQSRLRLASTNPLATPQVSDLSLAAFGNTIQAGVNIPQTKMYHKYIDQNVNDLAKASNYWAYFDKNKIAYFLARAGMPAPWIASSTPNWVDSTGTLQATFLDANITVEDSSDLYRNRQIIDNVLASTTINENRKGDGVSTSWTFGNQWAGVPTITVNGVTATVGVKNVDTGKQFYYAVGDETITEDASGPIYDNTFTLNFSGPAQYLTYSQYDNTTEQAALAAIEGTSGIVVNVEDGTGLTKAQGDALAQDRVNQYGVRGRLIKATTRRSGLAPGQLLPVFLPEHNINDGLFLVRQILTHLSTEFGVQQGIYTIEAISGPDVGDWTKLYQRA